MTDQIQSLLTHLHRQTLLVRLWLDGTMDVQTALAALEDIEDIVDAIRWEITHDKR